MFQIVEQTHEERVKMYMRCTKKELAEMLANRSALDDAQRFKKLDVLPVGDCRSGHIYQSNT